MCMCGYLFLCMCTCVCVCARGGRQRASPQAALSSLCPALLWADGTLGSISPPHLLSCSQGDHHRRRHSSQFLSPLSGPCPAVGGLQLSAGLTRSSVSAEGETFPEEGAHTPPLGRRCRHSGCPAQIDTIHKGQSWEIDVRDIYWPLLQWTLTVSKTLL